MRIAALRASSHEVGANVRATAVRARGTCCYLNLCPHQKQSHVNRLCLRLYACTVLQGQLATGGAR